MGEKTLKLVLKRKWWDMIVSGEKREEYRDLSDFWAKRILGNPVWNRNGDIIDILPISQWTLDKLRKDKRSLKDELQKGNAVSRYGYVTFYLGYDKNRPSLTFQIKGIEIRQGRPEWGAEPGKEYFVLRFGRTPRMYSHIVLNESNKL